MRRRALLACAVAAAACGGRKQREDLLPAQVGEWRRTSMKDLPASAEAPITAAVVQRIQSGQYEGKGSLDVTLYELSSSAAALDAVQRWRSEHDSVFFYKDEYFVVVRYRNADRAALNAFVRDFSRNLAPPK